MWQCAGRDDVYVLERQGCSDESFGQRLRVFAGCHGSLRRDRSTQTDMPFSDDPKPSGRVFYWAYEGDIVRSWWVRVIYEMGGNQAMGDERARRRKMGGYLFVVAVLGSVLAATGWTVHTVPAPGATTAFLSAKPMAVLDPFTLTTVTMARRESTVKVAGSPSSFVRPDQTDPIRIPARPPLRSAFRPIP